ncbi:FRG domain-containing protein [Sorangium cellulosum]|uniref:FRG domain-containing protein n=1 Tax=Sorangium cellulosum TaxID=56 RepID=UPI000CF41C25
MYDFQFLPQNLLDQAPAPTTTHELIEELTSWETTESVWRGQPRTWALHSGAARVALRARSEVPLHASRQLEDLVSMYEDALLAEARSRGYFGPETADLAALAILQHNGAATRFLDATTNLLVAAWFACSADKDDDGLLMLLPRGKEIGGDELRVPYRHSSRHGQCTLV